MKPISNDLILRRFFPYRLSVLSNRVSGLIAREYSERFALRIPEWRVVAVLGEESGLTVTQIAARTAMDKVSVSRAVRTLVEREHVERIASQLDGRLSHLQLTSSGSEIYSRIAPLALKYERAITGELSPWELDRLNTMMDTLLEQVRKIEEHGLEHEAD